MLAECFWVNFCGEPEIREWTNPCQEQSHNLQIGTNSLWSPQVFICELPKEGQIRCAGACGGYRGPWREAQCWDHGLGRPHGEAGQARNWWMLDPGAWGEGNYAPEFARKHSWWVAAYKHWKPQTLSLLIRFLVNSLFCLCRLGYRELFCVFPPGNFISGVLSYISHVWLSTSTIAFDDTKVRHTCWTAGSKYVVISAGFTGCSAKSFLQDTPGRGC